MTNQDLQQIKILFQDLFRQGFAEVWEFNIEPAFTDLENRMINRMDSRFTQFEGRLSRVESQMVTKDYLDEKIWALRAEINPRLKRIETKSSKLTKILHTKQVIEDSDYQELESM